MKMSLVYSSVKGPFIWECVLIFIMELTDEVKIQFYELKKASIKIQTNLC